ncbi:MAG TPA: sugar O-acetyltransferase [Victivallales bacterium]|nr:sugar O-acetyltransferase [Victivallales bacterium]
MKTEKEKMLAGEFYRPYTVSDSELTKERNKVQKLIRKLNNLCEDQIDLKNEVLEKILEKPINNLSVWTPFYCTYGYNISIGKNVFFNYNCTLLDTNQINIGDTVLIGPGVHIYTSTHPLNWQERSSGLQASKPVNIGSNVWIGGNVTICPGVNIGDRVVIGAGSVVTESISADIFAAGNPCRAKKSLIM